MKRIFTGTLFLVLFSMPLLAQPTAEQAILAAVSPMPDNLREEAKVMGYNEAGEMVTLREGSNEMICLADKPGDDRFHVACYHNSLEPFMARGRELRAEGITGADSRAVRFKEAEEGKLEVPDHPASLYSLSGKADAYDYAMGKVVEASPLYVVYIPFATEESTGLSTKPVGKGAPWIMHSGTAGAHIMIVSGETRSDN